MNDEAVIVVPDPDDGKISIDLAQSLMQELKAAKSRNLQDYEKFQQTRQNLTNQINDLTTQLKNAQDEQSNAIVESRKVQAELDESRRLVEQILKEKEQLQETHATIYAMLSNTPAAKPSSKRKSRSPSVEIVAVRKIPSCSPKVEDILVKDAPKAPVSHLDEHSESSNKRRKVDSKIKIEPKVEVMEKRISFANALTISSQVQSATSPMAQPTPTNASSSSSSSTPSQSTPQQQQPKAITPTTQAVSPPQAISDKSTSSQRMHSTSSPTVLNSTKPSAASSIQLNTPINPGAISSNQLVTTRVGSSSTPAANIPAASSSAPTASSNEPPSHSPVLTQSRHAAIASVATTPVDKPTNAQCNKSADSDMPTPLPKVVLTIPPRPLPTPQSTSTVVSEPKPPLPSVSKYLSGCPNLAISPPPTNLDFPREFLSRTYGGNPQTFVNVIKKNPSGSGVRRIVFPMQIFNPFVPRHPGEPGLIFASRHEILSDPPWTVFVKRENISSAVWSYQGEYECTLCGTMNAEEFLSQEPKVQNRWAKAVLKAKTFDVYVIMRARIALRKSGLIPLKDKKAESDLIKQEMEKIKLGEGRKIDIPEILDALKKGDEAVDIILMKCVKYDHVFANHMKDQFPAYQEWKSSRTGKVKDASVSRVPSTRKRKAKSVAVSSSTSQSAAEGSNNLRASAPAAMSSTVVPARRSNRHSLNTNTPPSYRSASSNHDDSASPSDDDYDDDSDMYTASDA